MVFLILQLGTTVNTGPWGIQPIVKDISLSLISQRQNGKILKSLTIVEGNKELERF